MIINDSNYYIFNQFNIKWKVLRSIIKDCMWIYLCNRLVKIEFLRMFCFGLSTLDWQYCNKINAVTWCFLFYSCTWLVFLVLGDWKQNSLVRKVLTWPWWNLTHGRQRIIHGISYYFKLSLNRFYHLFNLFLLNRWYHLFE